VAPNARDGSEANFPRGRWDTCWIFCSGQGAFDPATGQLVPGGIQEQTRRVLRNIDAVLRAAGTGLDRVVKVTVFLADWKYFKGMNEAYAEFFGSDRAPARSTVQGDRCPEGHLVATEAIALEPQPWVESCCRTTACSERRFAPPVMLGGRRLSRP
jgi:2-iminobutanoate/2-iminopropanoate deaminase